MYAVDGPSLTVSTSCHGLHATTRPMICKCFQRYLKWTSKG